MPPTRYVVLATINAREAHSKGKKMGAGEQPVAATSLENLEPLVLMRRVKGYIGAGSDHSGHIGGNRVEFPLAHRASGRSPRGRPGAERTRAAANTERTRGPQDGWAFPAALARTNPAGEGLA
jgi:hypothetical protein